MRIMIVLKNIIKKGNIISADVHPNGSDEIRPIKINLQTKEVIIPKGGPNCSYTYHAKINLLRLCDYLERKLIFELPTEKTVYWY